MEMINNSSGSVVNTPKKAEKGSDEVVVEIDGGWESEGEKFCRICHLSREIGAPTKSSELILIGCGCRGELGFSHRDCGEAWFGAKGNRYCEICSLYAKNIIGKDDSNFMEEWHEGRMLDDVNIGRSSDRVRCWRSHAFCNFLMACLVIAFVLPWFFHVKMFRHCC